MELDNTYLVNQLPSNASFCSVCKKVALAIKEKHSSKTWSGQNVLNHFWFQIFTNVVGSPLREEVLGIICHNLLYFAILTYIKEL